MPDMSTVFGRSQMNGGFISGPDHTSLGVDRMQREMGGESQGPPNLRESEDPQMSCAQCMNYMDGMCEMHDAEVQPTQVCDTFEGLEEGDSLGSGDLMPGMMG